ncbi:MAG: hypothetical protein U0W40_05930 [Acidimicrobiia bacterium]
MSSQRSDGSNSRFERPVTASALFATREMRLRYPGEVEVSREGTDEGQGRGFDLADLSAGADRTIAAPDPAMAIVTWFAGELTRLDWTDESDGWLRRDPGEVFFARVERDRGTSRVGSMLENAEARRIQEEFEDALYQGVPGTWSIVTLFYTVAPDPDAGQV